VNRTRLLVTAAAVLAVVLGGGAALAATGSSTPASDFLGDVAKRLGISQDKLEDAIKDATIARIDAAVVAGDITKEEGDALKERVRSGDVPAILPSFRGPGPGLGPLGQDGMLGPGRLVGTDLFDAAADYLGMTEADVREALRDRKSLADLARDKGKSVAGLKEALRDKIRRDADQAVEDGALTDQEADRLVEKLSNVVDELVEQSGGPGLEFGFGGPAFGLGPLGPLDKGIFPGAFPGTDLMEAAADYLGIDGADVREALRDGKSLAELARDKGKSVDGLKKALRAAIRKDADQAVEDGVLTRAQANRLVEKFGNAIDKLVEGNSEGGFDFDFRSGGGSFEFHFRIAPEGRMPSPEGRANESPSPEPAIFPSQPI
jgi:lambda repressor-like predicted transcriptional regulator